MPLSRPLLRRHLLLGALLGLLLPGAPRAAAARPRPPYAVAGHEAPVALLRAGRATYLVTQRSVFRLEGTQFVRKYQSPNVIQCAAAADTVLWLGTQQGALGLGLGPAGFRPHPLALPGAAATARITTLFQDAQGALWAGADGYGAFRRAPGGTFVAELNTPAITAGAATADGSVWLGTNVGLSRKQGPEWTRYNEEGVANREIPDNLVEKLLPDNTGALWVIMSDAISVLNPAPQAAGEAEVPTVKFLGQPGNEVFGVASVPGAGRVFATAMGLLLLPAAAPGPLAAAPATDEVAPQRLLVPLPALPGATTSAPPVLVQVDAQQRVWLASADEVTVLTAKQFRKFAQRAPAAAAGLASRP
ncbi:hypothetical protein [Hymenobacter sp. PAMC 26628]|uniref:hypothetical protein n=1 Tax=Hymenobacter sp. PAMC 26628 TaxID=1484118 RepID=UPI0007700DCB|nr:hypothetical protein [Hymenobacter sp. PAMC 26628]AMJ65695.1 hypothetical protein AXW84_09840 [Hymenobacter sp. PAMC 26628]